MTFVPIFYYDATHLTRHFKNQNTQLESFSAKLCVKNEELFANYKV